MSRCLHAKNQSRNKCGIYPNPFRLRNQKWDTYHIITTFLAHTQSDTAVWLDRVRLRSRRIHTPKAAKHALGKSLLDELVQHTCGMGGPYSGPPPRRSVPARRPLCRRRPIGARSAKPLGQLWLSWVRPLYIYVASPGGASLLQQSSQHTREGRPWGRLR